MRNTCYSCDNVWGQCTCEIDGEECFEFNGTVITDPTVSECGRFFVDPVVYYGLPFLQWKAAKIAAALGE